MPKRPRTCTAYAGTPGVLQTLSAAWDQRNLLALNLALVMLPGFGGRDGSHWHREHSPSKRLRIARPLRLSNPTTFRATAELLLEDADTFLIGG